jgi:colanic acid/amylovoran biosynthesis glycosyltransferase
MSNKLKILFLVPSFPSVSETFIVNQIVDLIDRGHQVTIFSGAKNNVLIHPKIIEYKLLEKTIFQDVKVNPFFRILLFFKTILFVKNKYRFQLLKSINFFKYKKEAITLSRFFSISWIAKTNDDFDIVHAHFGFMSDYFFKAQEFDLLKSAKLIVTFHGYDIEPKDVNINKLRYDNLINCKSTITVNTPYLMNIVHQTLGKNINCHILPVGLDTTYYKNEINNNSSDKIYIIFCGRFVKFKGIELLPKIANEIINNRGCKQVYFNIIGDGYEEIKIQLVESINSYGLDNYFKLYGFLSQKDSIKIVSSSHIFILPGIYDNQRAETQGLVIQEAQSLGLPVVVTDAGGMKYGVLDEVSGFVIENQDIKKFCDKIEALIDNEDLRIKMGNAGREFIVKNYDSKVLGNKLEKLYYSILN